jgi:hypothetical protein
LVKLPAKPAFSLVDTPEIGYAPCIRQDLCLDAHLSTNEMFTLDATFRMLGVSAGDLANVEAVSRA